MIRVKNSAVKIKGRAANVAVEAVCAMRAIRNSFSYTDESKELMDVFCKVLQGEMDDKQAAIALAKIILSLEGAAEFEKELLELEGKAE